MHIPFSFKAQLNIKVGSYFALLLSATAENLPILSFCLSPKYYCLPKGENFICSQKQTGEVPEAHQGWPQIPSLVQFSSVAQSCPTLCDPMNCSMPGLPVHHQLPEFTQTHVHRGSDAIQPSHPLLSPSPPAPNPSQHQSLFQ